MSEDSGGLMEDEECPEDVSLWQRWFSKHKSLVSSFLRALMLILFGMAMRQAGGRPSTLLVIAAFFFLVRRDSNLSLWEWMTGVKETEEFADDEDWRIDASADHGGSEQGYAEDNDPDGDFAGAMDHFSPDMWKERESELAGSADAGDEGAAISKDSMDLLMRYMASVESQKQDQGHSVQRQKLQRKLLLRHLSKTGRKASASNGNDTAQDCVVQDATALEELLKELEPEQERPKVVAKGPRRAVGMKRRGVPAGKPAKPESQPVQDESEEEREVNVEPTVSKAVVPPPEDDPELFELLQKGGFQVVGNRRKRLGPRTAETEHFVQAGGANSNCKEADAKGESAARAVSKKIIFGSLGPDDPEEEQRPASSAEKAADDLKESYPTEVKDDQDWEWQCPAGHPLAPYVCPGPLRCSSCGAMQSAGASVLRSSASEWLACKDCISLAYDRPVEMQPSSEATSDVPDPKRMSAVEIAEWFQEQCAEDALKACMEQVLSKRKARGSGAEE